MKTFSLRHRYQVTSAAVLLCLAGNALAAPSAKPEPSAKPIAQAAKPQPDRARAVFKQTIAQLIRKQDYDAAKKGFLEAARLDPGYASPHYNLGILSEMEGKWQDAVEHYRAFLKLEATSARAGVARRKIVELKTPEGQRQARHAVKLAWAKNWLEVGATQRAVAAAAEAAATNAADWEAPVVAATALLEAGEFTEEATELLRDAVSKAPADRKAALKDALAQCEREAQAGKLLTEAEGAMKSKQYAKAAESYAQAWQVNPDRGEIGLMAATAWMHAGDQDKAAAILSRLATDKEASVAERAKGFRARIDAMTAGVQDLKKALSQPAPEPKAEVLSSNMDKMAADLDRMKQGFQTKAAAALKGARSGGGTATQPKPEISERDALDEVLQKAAEADNATVAKWAKDLRSSGLNLTSLSADQVRLLQRAVSYLSSYKENMKTCFARLSSPSEEEANWLRQNNLPFGLSDRAYRNRLAAETVKTTDADYRYYVNALVCKARVHLTLVETRKLGSANSTDLQNQMGDALEVVRQLEEQDAGKAEAQRLKAEIEQVKAKVGQ